jgi:hypothetical protein
VAPVDRLAARLVQAARAAVRVKAAARASVGGAVDLAQVDWEARAEPEDRRAAAAPRLRPKSSRTFE